MRSGAHQRLSFMQHTYHPCLIVQGRVFVASMHETCRVRTTSFLCTYNSRPHVYYDSELEGIKQLPRRRTNLGCGSAQNVSEILLYRCVYLHSRSANLSVEVVQHYLSLSKSLSMQAGRAALHMGNLRIVSTKLLFPISSKSIVSNLFLQA